MPTALDTPRRVAFGFIAGFLATLVFHQLTLLVLSVTGIAPFGAYPMSPVPPLGVPAVLSLAFWGGVWGVVFAFLHDRFPAGTAYWIAAFLFGGLATTLIALFVVAPLKGQPMAAGGDLTIWLVAFLINGAWGLGTGVFLRMLTARFGRRTWWS